LAALVLQWRIVAKFHAALKEHAVALRLILDKLIEHRLVAGGVEVPPAGTDSDIEQLRHLVAQDSLKLDPIASSRCWIGAERQIMRIERSLPYARIGSLGLELQGAREPDVYDSAGAERVP